jgi:hypothetical protein
MSHKDIELLLSNGDDSLSSMSFEQFKKKFSQKIIE